MNNGHACVQGSVGLWRSKDLFPTLGVLVSPVWGTVLDYGDAGSNLLEGDQRDRGSTVQELPGHIPRKLSLPPLCSVTYCGQCRDIPRNLPSLIKGGPQAPTASKGASWAPRFRWEEQKRACLEVPPQGDQPPNPMSARRSRQRLWLPVFLMLGLYSEGPH